jgi:hypothetical protein
VAGDRLTFWHRAGLGVLALVVVLFGGLVTYRSAFSTRRMGDVSMLFRAGWAARTGGSELYSMTSANGLHYHYPPTFAILMGGFADAPDGRDKVVALPFAAAVAVWYTINVVLVLLGIHLIANVLESAGGSPPQRFGRRWWMLRALPFLVCVPCIGSTLNQGQVTPLLFALIAGSFWFHAKRRPLASGVTLALAIAIKIFPAFLALAPLVGRESKRLAGIALGLFVALVVVPCFYYGPSQTFTLYRELEEVLIGPAFGWGGDTSRKAELFHAAGPHSQSLVSAFNSIIHPDRATRPAVAAPLARALHWTVGGLMTLLTLAAFRYGRNRDEASSLRRHVLFGGTLVLVMLLVCPVSHLHYLMLALPAAIALVGIDLADAGRLTRPTALWLAIHFLTVVLAQLPGLEPLKDKCLPAYGLIALWSGACWTGLRLGGYRVVWPDTFAGGWPAVVRVGAPSH